MSPYGLSHNLVYPLLLSVSGETARTREVSIHEHEIILFCHFLVSLSKGNHLIVCRCRGCLNLHRNPTALLQPLSYRRFIVHLKDNVQPRRQHILGHYTRFRTQYFHLCVDIGQEIATDMLFLGFSSEIRPSIETPSMRGTSIGRASNIPSKQLDTCLISSLSIDVCLS